jgi:Ca2+-binding RTX toxin-like protein
MVGGAGSDIMYVDDIGDQVHDDVGGGDDTVISTFALTHAFNAEIETYIFKTNADLNFTGNNISEEIHGGSGKDVIDGAGGQSDRLFGGAGNDTLIGADGTDTLDGGTGADTMTGGNGDDYYYVDNVGDKIVETSGLGTGNDWEYSTISIDLLPYQVDNGVLLGTAALHLTGNGTANELFGNNGANTIDGGQGADIMFGGGGNDIFIVDNTNDVAAELLGGAVGGIDLVKSSVGFALGANIENLTLTGTYSTYGTGNALDNTIIGNDVGNELDGGAGKDTMSGGKGDDFYHVDNAGDKVVEAAAGGTQDVVFSTVSASLVKFANVEVLYLDGAADINATGSIRDEELHGNSGKNVLDGGKGADVMKGRDGDDTYYVDNLGDKVSESSGAGTDTMISTIAFANVVANVENYTFNTTTAVHFTGDAGDNVVKGGSGGDIIDGAGGQDTLFGGAGNDTLAGGSLGDLLDGGKGADIMSGGGGNDLYFVDNIADDVQETGLPNAGTDAVFSSVSVDLLWGNVENLQLQGTAALHATGNSLDNIISGNDGGNVLNGGAGIDFLFGHKGNDTLTGGSGSDTFHFNLSGPGNEGHDTITDFVNAEDVLSFIVGDVNNDKVVDIKDLLVGMSVVDHGIGKAVDVHFADGSEITFAGVGTNTITHIEQLVADATTQIHVN